MAAPKGTRPPAAGRGRKKGEPNKITRDLKEMILGALDDAGGREYLKARALDTPGPFLALVGKVLPTTLQGGDEKKPLRFLISFEGPEEGPDE